MTFMDAKDFLRMFDYDSWANRECIAAMRGAAGSVSPDMVGRMAHILSAQKLWLERILNQPQSMPVWPSATIEECVTLAEQVSSVWRNYLKTLSQRTLSQQMLGSNVKYRNSKAEPWSSRVDDILTHVLFHSAYHRGQIALQMRASGFAPASTDFISHSARGVHRVD
jgi:uncharacterized damage-inducible protein DinB